MLVLLLLAALIQVPSPTAQPKNPVVNNGKTQIEGNKSAHQAKGKLSPALAPDPTPKGIAPQATEERTKANPDDRVYRVKVMPEPTNWWYVASVICTGLAAVLGLGTLVAVWHQRGVMKDQHAAMRDQLTEMQITREQTIAQLTAAGKQTDKLIIQAERNAVAAFNNAETAKATLERMIEANRINREALQSVQRAYVAFSIVGLEETKGVDAKTGDRKEWWFWIPVENTGVTPTKDLRLWFNWHWRNDPTSRQLCLSRLRNDAGASRHSG